MIWFLQRQDSFITLQFSSALRSLQRARLKEHTTKNHESKSYQASLSYICCSTKSQLLINQWEKKKKANIMRFTSTENTVVVLDLRDRKSKHVCITKHTAPGHTVTLYTLVCIIKHTSGSFLCCLIELSTFVSRPLFSPYLPQPPLFSAIFAPCCQSNLWIPKHFSKCTAGISSGYVCRILLKPQNSRSFKTLLSFFPSSLQCTWPRVHMKHLEALFFSCILQKMISGRKYQAMA